MKRITELSACECRWPVFEDANGHFFCAAVSDGAYCAAHRAVAYVPARTRPTAPPSWCRADGRVKGVQERSNDALVPPVDKLIASPVLKRFEASVGIHESA